MSDTQNMTYACKKIRKCDRAGVLLECEICNYSSTKKQLFYEHKLTKHTDVKHTCTECEYTHRFPNRVKSHYKHVHLKILRSSKCKIKSCKNGQRGICELPIHTSVFCDQCNFSSQYKQRLTVHVEMVHEGIVYRCDYCPDFNTGSKIKLSSHKRKVHNPKLLSCEEEGCIFTTRKQISLHRIH